MSERNNKLELLGSAPIPKALMALGIPIMIGMLINALYNLVDAYFVGGLGESQMGAISVVFPLGQVVVGLGLMFGNGAASYLSRLLGRGNKDTANRVASTALYSSILIGTIIILFSTIFLKPILAMLGATETIMPYAQRRKVKDFFIKFKKKSHFADFFTKHTLDFVLHRLLGGLAEMHTHDIGCLADLLSHSRARGTVGCGIVHSKSSCK